MQSLLSYQYFLALFYSSSFMYVYTYGCIRKLMEEKYNLFFLLSPSLMPMHVIHSLKEHLLSSHNRPVTEVGATDIQNVH